MIAAFEKETGIKVNYDTFENNEALHAKLVAGNTGYDIVVPGTVFAKLQIDGRPAAAAEQGPDPQPGQPRPGHHAGSDQGRPGQRAPGALGLGLHHRGHQQDQGREGAGRHAHARKRLGPGLQARVHQQAQELRHRLPGFAHRDHAGGAALHRQGRLLERPGRLQGRQRDAGQGAQGRAPVQLDHDRRHRRRQGLRGDRLVGRHQPSPPPAPRKTAPRT
jgi:hypothetical protein